MTWPLYAERPICWTCNPLLFLYNVYGILTLPNDCGFSRTKQKNAQQISRKINYYYNTSRRTFACEKSAAARRRLSQNHNLMHAHCPRTRRKYIIGEDTRQDYFVSFFNVLILLFICSHDVTNTPTYSTYKYDVDYRSKL